MKFDRTVNLILEESEEKPKYELISPEKYSRVYQENTRVFPNGYIRIVTELGRISNPVPIDRNDAKVEMMKKKWVPTVLLSGFELLLHIKRKNKKDVRKYKISRSKDNTQDVYIIHDTSDIALEAISYNYWLEPVVTFKDYTSQGTADAFDNLFSNL